MPEQVIEGVNKLMMLVTGEAGIGKTTFIATAEDHPCTSRCLIISLAGNPQVLYGRKGAQRPVVWAPEKSLRELVPLLAWIKAGQPDSPVRAQFTSLAPGEMFRTVCFDTLTEYQRIQASDIDVDLGALFVTHKMDFKEWGLMWGRSVNLARLLTQEKWPTHVVFTSQIKAGGEGFEPMLWGQSDFEVPSYVLTHAWLTQGQNVPREAKAEPYQRVLVVKEGYMAHRSLKWQYPNKPPSPFILDPSIPDLVHLIEGHDGTGEHCGRSNGVPQAAATE